MLFQQSDPLPGGWHSPNTLTLVKTSFGGSCCKLIILLKHYIIIANIISNLARTALRTHLACIRVVPALIYLL